MSTIAMVVLIVLGAKDAASGAIQPVGSLGNSSSLRQPVPYAFYTGLALDGGGRLYLIGASEGVPVCDQDGRCLAVLTLPKDAEGLVPRSQAVLAANQVVFALHARDGSHSVLCRVDTSPADAGQLVVRKAAEGPGHWAVSPTLTQDGHAVIGIGNARQRKYRVATLDAGGQLEEVATFDLPQGAMTPWRHLIQAEPDGSFGIAHLGGVNVQGRYWPHGQRLGDWTGGQIVDAFRYHFNYSGGLNRTDLDGKPAPGECGSRLEEIRMPAQMVRSGDRYFFAGRGGVCEARWDGTTFVYHRRIGGIWIDDLTDDGQQLAGIAWQAEGNADVQHPLFLPKSLPAAAILPARGPLHSRRAISLQRAASDALLVVYRDEKGIGLELLREGHGRKNVSLAEIKVAGQIARLAGASLLVADPAGGTIWQVDWREVPDQPKVLSAAVQPWRKDMPGVIGLGLTADAVYAATASQVVRLSRDGQTVFWTSPGTYRGIRRLAATPECVYVCDEAAGLVDQLDARTGQRLARLDGLKSPHAVAADLNAVYIAENGRGRVLIATTTLWRPQIPVLAREQPDSPIVAARLPVPPTDARISVNVYDPNDLTVRQLACAVDGQQPVLWDGRDYLGNRVQPGRYRFHGILVPQLSLRYVGSIGNAGQPPYRTADGRGSWGGVWGNVMDVCAVDDSPGSDILVLWAFEEGEGGLIRMSQEGDVRWKQHIQWWTQGQATALCSDGASAYVVSSSAKGAPGDSKEPFWIKPHRPLLWRVDVRTGAYRWYDPRDQQNAPMFGEYAPGDAASDATVHEGRLYITSPAQGRLFVVDAASGELIGQWPLDGVSGVAWDRQGRLLVGLGTQVAELDPDTGEKRRTLCDLGAAVWDVAPAATGVLAASVRGDRQQVVLLDAAGRELQSLGRRGGRPAHAKFVATDLFDPAGLCVTADGKLFVTEDSAPRRFSRWNVGASGATGVFERDWHGPYYLSGMWGVDEQQPEIFYGDSHGDVVRYEFNYDTGSWRVDAAWRKVYVPDRHGDVTKWMPRILHRNGKTYWASGSAGLVEIRDDAWLPVAAVYGCWVVPDEKEGWQWYHQARDRRERKGTWSDLNRDGRRQADEWFVTDKPAYPLDEAGPQQGWASFWSDDFTLYMHDWSDGAAAGIWRLRPQWENGVPVFRWEAAHHAGLNRVTGIGRGSHGCRTAFAANGAVYGFNGAYNDIRLPGVGHGADWRFAQITKYDEASGRPLWHAGERAAGFGKAGEIACPVGASGLIDDYLFWTDENSLVHVWDDRYGLYVGTLLEDLMRNPDPSPYTVWVELFNTRIWRHPKTGKVYLGAASDAIHVYEVLGINRKLERFRGEFDVTASGLAAAQREWEARQRPQQTVRALRIPRAARPPELDGDLSEFGPAPAAAFALKPGAQGSARLMYDADNLYAAFDVEDDSPWRNSGGDLSTLFKTGDCVDIWLGPNAGKRPPGLGDVRVLIAPVNGQPTAVLFEQKVAYDARPVPFRSPSGEVVLDRVSPLSEARIAVVTSPHGYRLEAAIPWKSLGHSPEAARLGLDLDINFSDSAGQRNTARLHWGRHGAATVYDLPTEARLEPELWGEGILER